jgi:hypothetical protein
MERVALLAVAAAFFAAYPAQSVVYITGDGQAFTEKNRSFGLEHAKAKFAGVLEKVTRAEVEAEAEGDPGTTGRSEEDQAVIDARLEVLKGLGLKEPVAKKLRVSGFEDLSKLTENQLAEYNGILDKEKQTKTD